MNVDDLKDLRKEIMEIYDEEKKLKEDNKKDKLLDKELEYLKNEIDKVDTLIEIYKDENIDYRLMKLERLYMQIMSEMSEKEFSKLSYDEEVDVFDRFFPDRWSFAVPIEKKLEYLEEAICTNKMLDQICSIDSKKNNVFLKKWGNINANEK